MLCAVRAVPQASVLLPVMERILLIGSGGREHALAQHLASSASCEALWCAPGNPGIASIAECFALEASNHESVVAWCKQHAISLVVIGPEQPLTHGLADSLRSAGIDAFGPSQRAAQLESSKGFSKDFMQRNGIPTAPYRRFEKGQREHATAYVLEHTLPVVVKYDGLAAGKGVVVAYTHAEAAEAIELMYAGAFGNDGVVVEGFLRGEEASVFAVCDGSNYVTLAPAQDHKRVGNGDTGKNTGGMGAYAPASVVNDYVLEQIRQRIIEPVLAGMAQEGTPFVGCLFCGLMIENDEPSVVEFNVRFGDPETQAVLAVFRGDFAGLLASAARGMVNQACITNAAYGYACNVVLASRGYPDDYEKGVAIVGIQRAEEDPFVTVYHAGTQLVSEALVTSGGRVLGVTAWGEVLAESVHRSYAAIDKIEYTSKMYRTDIAARAL